MGKSVKCNSNVRFDGERCSRMCMYMASARDRVIEGSMQGVLCRGIIFFVSG